MEQTTQAAAERRVMLFKREGSADKVYQATLRPGAEHGTFDVVGENARRGQALRPAKRFAGLPLAEATAEFERLVKGKMKDGYPEQEHGQAYTSSEFAGRDSGLRPQLPKVATEDMLAHLLADPRWGMQEKANGENRVVQLDDAGFVRGINKKGLWVEIPQSWVDKLRKAATDPLVLCGEHVGDKLYAFDALVLGGRDVRHLAFRERYTLLVHMLASWNIEELVLLEAHFTPEVKARRLPCGWWWAKIGLFCCPWPPRSRSRNESRAWWESFNPASLSRSAAWRTAEAS